MDVKFTYNETFNGIVVIPPLVSVKELLPFYFTEYNIINY